VVGPNTYESRLERSPNRASRRHRSRHSPLARRSCRTLGITTRMTTAQAHCESLLAPVYLWMAGGIDHALALGAGDISDCVGPAELPVGILELAGLSTSVSAGPRGI